MRPVRLLAAAALSAGMLAVPLTAAPAASAAPAITWEDCPERTFSDRTECGRIEVPKYYDAPDKGTISVGFVRLPATGERRGTLFTNPGGPGGDAYSWTGTAQWPEAVTEEFDIIGVQPRGLAGSTPVECAEANPNQDPISALSNIGGETRALCEQKTPGYTDSLTTENTARDWEMVRQALGEERINIAGLSYGTFLGSTYATLYPQHTDKVVLDSGMDPGLAWNGIFASQQAGYENALHDFFRFVADNDATYHMGNTPLKAYERWSQKVASEVGVRPTVLPPDAEIGDLPPGLEFAGQPGADIMTATGELRVQAEFLVDKAKNPNAVQAQSPTLAITRSIVPRPSTWDEAAKFFAGQEEMPAAPSAADQEQAQKEILAVSTMQNLIMCNENTVPDNPAMLPDFLWSSFVTVDPFTIVNAMYTSGLGCRGHAPSAKPIAVSGAQLSTKPLQIQATGDPQTPYKYHGGLAAPMQSHVVTVHGPGHGHFAQGNKAVDDIVVDYLRTGNVSATDAPGYFDQPAPAEPAADAQAAVPAN
ncbi:alpha/beta fold hydrolase [Corynebacterium sp.]|uniref:alpha/beta fold hydrolase n=1 Tax=Corynebacterium sp. TaxID=1720 RepID=UPI0026DD4589|nr:alpha/beta fold hydrolase [Corynebacterium sp.]MDO5031970.1 alpha/beta fold hydrolase [Corynebacterium sp.]